MSYLSSILRVFVLLLVLLFVALPGFGQCPSYVINGPSLSTSNIEAGETICISARVVEVSGCSSLEDVSIQLLGDQVQVILFYEVTTGICVQPYSEIDIQECVSLPSAGNYGVTLFVRENGSPAGSCSVGSVSVEEPVCNLTSSGLSNITCADNGSPNDPSDDRVRFSLNPQGANVGAGYRVLYNGSALSPDPATYGSTTTFTSPAGLAGEGSFNVSILDVDDNLCREEVTIADPGICSESPPCDAPAVSQISASEVTANTGVLECSLQGVERYDWRYRRGGQSGWNNLSSTAGSNRQLTGLQPETTYEFQVRVRCGDSNWSDWSLTESFTTAAEEPDCTDNAHEPNESIGEASTTAFNTLGNSNSDQVLSALIAPQDQDYYRIRVTQSGSFTLNLTDLPANYQMVLYDASGGILSFSTNAGLNDESITYGHTASGDQNFYVRVYGSNGVSDCEATYLLELEWTPEAAEPACRQQDSLALVEFYNATDGPNWTYDDNSYYDGRIDDYRDTPNAGTPWNFNTPISTWHGVEVNASGCVTGLILVSNNLSGPLPDVNLPNLERFWCHGNELSGPIPDFSNLPNLEFFDCSSNNLSGLIPDFSNLPDLEYFDCQSNNLSGPIPDLNLPNLEEFWCQSNNLSGPIPDLNLPNLEVFWCDGNNLSGPLPDFSNLPNLEVFNCRFNDLSGAIPDFSNLPNLELFDCGSNELSGAIPDFSNLPNLELFDCGSNELSGAIPDFSNLPNLERFDCGSNELSGPLPDFSNLPNLERFDCDFNNLSGPLPDFSNLPNLESFDCDNNELSGPLPDFSNLPNLEGFSCNDNELSGPIPDFSNLPNLEDFRCSHNNLSGPIPDLSDNCPALNDFEVEENRFTFEHLLPSLVANETITAQNADNSGDSLRYAPQANIFADTTLIGAAGESLTINLGIDAGITDNVYTWYKDGAAYRTLTGNNQLTFNSLTTADAGVYTVEVANPGAPELTLESFPITLQVEDAPCRRQDSLALVELYNATGGPNWTNTWDLNAPMSTWYGVTLNAEGCVTCLDLDGNPSCSSGASSGNNLVGELIDLNLPQLEGLYIARNNLSGPIPDFSNLPNLERFWCYSNELSGPLPDFSNLPNLEVFDCYDNNLSGPLPDFSNLPNLEIFDCVDNELSGPIPDFSNLPNLEIFDCVDNELSGPIPDFSNLPNLVEFRCRSNELSGPLPDFSNLPNLVVFLCRSNELSGPIPDFSNLPNLVSFDCDFNNLSGPIPDFSDLLNLEFFDCDFNNLSGSIPDFSNLPNLEFFDCSNNELSGPLPDLSDNCPALRSFYVEDNRFTFEHLLPSLVANETIIAQNAVNSEDSLRYAPQDSIFADTTLVGAAGESLTINLGIDAGITDNVYTWYKNGSPYRSINGNNDLEFPNLQPSDAGLYRVEVTNPEAPELTLYSYDITLEVISGSIRLIAGEAEGNLGETIRLPIMVENADRLAALQGQINFGKPDILTLTGIEAAKMTVELNAENVCIRPTPSFFASAPAVALS